MFFVYIIYSERLKRYYTGTTDNVWKRVEEHNSARYDNAFTAKGIPWNYYFHIECQSSQQAYKVEKFIKQMKSARFIERLKEDEQIVTDILKRFV